MISLHIFTAKTIVFLGRLKAKLLEASINGPAGNLVPKVNLLRRVDNRSERIEVKILLRSQEWNVGFLNSTGDEKGLLPIWLFFQPTRNRSSVLTILMLLIGQPARAISGRSLGIELRLRLLLKRPPGLAILG